MSDDDWKPLGKRDIRRQRLKNFQKKIDFRGCHTAVCPCSGIFATSEVEPDTITLSSRPMLRLRNADGSLMAEERWKSGRIVFMFFALDVEVLNLITEDGKLLQFDLVLKLTSSFSVSSEEILEAQVFHHESTLGLVILTTSGNFSVLPVYHNSLKRLEIGPITESVPDCWTVISSKNRCYILSAVKSNFYTVAVDGSSRVEVHPITVSKGFNHLMQVTASLSGAFCAATTDSGVQLMINSTTLEVITELNTAAKIKSSPIKASVISSSGPFGPIAALLWTEFIVLLDTAKNWAIYDLDSFSIMVEEKDGLRVLGTKTHDFITTVHECTKHVTSPTGAGAMLIDAFEMISGNNERGEEIIAVLRDEDSPDCQLVDAVEQCIKAATYEHDVTLQKKYLKAASFGLVLCEEFDPNIFATANKTMRVLNQLRSAPGLAITIDQFNQLGPMGIIQRLQNRGLYTLAWLVVGYLQLYSKYPQLKTDLLTSWAQSLVRNCEEDKYENVTRRISSRVEELKCAVSFIDIAREAARSGKKELSLSLVELEPRYRPKVELLLEISPKGERALECALASQDPDLIYLCLLHIHAKRSKDEYTQVLKKYPAAAAQYALYCKEHNKRMLEELHDPAEHALYLAMGHLSSAKAAGTDFERKFCALEAAERSLKMAGVENAIQNISTHKQLLEAQRDLEKTHQHINWVGKPLKHSLLTLMPLDTAACDRLAKDLKFNERFYTRMKATYLAGNGKYEELDKMLSKVRRSAALAPDQIIKIIADSGNKPEAQKWLQKCQGRTKVKAYINLKEFVQAASAANQLGDFELIGKCHKLAQQVDMDQANEITSRYAS